MGKSEPTSGDKYSVAESKMAVHGGEQKGPLSLVSASDLASCLVDPSSFITTPTIVTISPPASNNCPPLSLSGTLASLNGPPISASDAPLLGPLTTSSLLDPLAQPPPTNDLDGLSDWFNFEECVQTATKEEAREPLENGRQENLINYSQNTPVVPETIEDVACTHLPPGNSVSGQGSQYHTSSPACEDVPREESSHSEGGTTIKRKRGRPKKIPGTSVSQQEVQVDSIGSSVKRGRGSPKKNVCTPATSVPGVQLIKDGCSAKKKRGRPRKHTICLGELPVIAAATASLKKSSRRSGDLLSVSVKKEPIDFEKLNLSPRPRPSVTQSASKKKKKTHKKSTKATAALITEVFEKPAPRAGSTSQITVEDSGYSTYISGSDSGSRSSHIPVSHSPADSITSPVLLDYPQPAIAMTFDESSQNILIKDPVLSLLDRNEDVTVSVLESGQGCGSGSDTFRQSVMPQVSGEVMLEGCGDSTAVPSDRDLILQLDELLKDEASPIFTEDMMIGDTQEVTTYEDEEDILNSDIVTDCLKELQLCGRIGGPSHLPSEHPLSDPTSSDMANGRGRLRRVKRVSHSCTPDKSAKLPAAAPQALGARGLSMVNSRTKSGRVSKPSTRMKEFTKGLNSPSPSSEGNPAPTAVPPTLPPQKPIPTESTDVSRADGHVSPEAVSRVTANRSESCQVGLRSQAPTGPPTQLLPHRKHR